MTNDLEDRIHRYAIVIDDAIDADLVARSRQQNSDDATTGSRMAGPLLAIAAAAVTVVGLGVIVANRDEPAPAANAPIEPPASLPAPSAPIDPTGRGVVIEIPQQALNADGSTAEDGVPAVDPIRVAPGALGWFEATTSPTGEIDEWADPTTELSPEALAAFFGCAEWVLDSGGPICERLGGGNGIEHFDYASNDGPSFGVGVQLGGTDVRSQLWNQAYGQIWGYEQITEVPEPTEIPFGDTTGLSYRVDGQAYLAWEYEPGVVVWIHSRGLTNDQLATVAEGVVPVQLPDTLPLLLELRSPDYEPVPPMPGDRVEDVEFLVNSNNPPTLKYGTLSGQPCVAFDFFEECRSTEAPAMIPSIEWASRTPDRFVAIAPSGSGLTLRTTAIDGTVTDNALTDTGLGFELATWTPTRIDEHLASASLVDLDSNIVAETGPLGEFER